MAPLEVLAVHEDPRAFDALGERLPEVGLHAVESWEEAEPHLATAQILVTLGHGFSRDVAARMPALRWLQSMTAGVDGALGALAGRPDVLLTSARGIHGPQMTEAALYHMLCLSRDVRRSVRAQGDHRWERWDPRLL